MSYDDPQCIAAHDDLAARVLAAIGRVQVLVWIAPLDLAAVKLELRDAVAGGRNSIARWTYGEPQLETVLVDLQTLRSEVETAEWDFPELQRQTLDSLDRAVASTHAVSARNDDGFAVWNRQAYGVPHPDVIAAALGILDSALPDEPVQRLSATALAAAVTAALAAYELSEWTVGLDPGMVVSMSVRPARRQIVVRADARFSHGDARRLLVHEVGSHVLRSVNSRRQPEHLARLGFRHGTATEEGLAAWHEEHLGVSSRTTLRGYAARAIAVDIAYREGIVATTRHLEQLVGLDRAVDIAVRVKRGLVDPNQPGCFAKDQAYLSGLLELREGLESHPDDRGLLMTTKWPLGMLPLARELLDAGRLTGSPLLPDSDRLGIDAFAEN